jgi:hypothetical protein
MSKKFEDFMQPVAEESDRNSAMHQKHVMGMAILAMISWFCYKISEKVKNVKRFFSK